jgi:hypothetical protein
MYLIVEKSSNRHYVFRESSALFARVEKERGRERLTKLRPKIFDAERDLSDMPNNSYVVFKLETKKAAKKSVAKPKKKKSRGT